MTDQTPTRPDNIDGLIERLNEAMDGAAIRQHGGVLCLPQDLRGLLSYLRWVEERAVEVLEPFLAANRESIADHRPKWGLADCVDNHGVAYQSQFLADALSRASTFSHELRGDNQKAGEQPLTFSPEAKRRALDLMKPDHGPALEIEEVDALRRKHRSGEQP